MARTQQQRREDTIARLLDASIETIIEVGYARASAKVIARRAEVSDGALFRHFPTMGDFMAATAYEAGRRQLEAAAKRIADIGTEKPTLEDVLTIMRDLTINSTNTVLYELAVAARTDEKLREALRGVMEVYLMKIYEEARAALADDVEALGEDNFAAQLAVVVNTLDGAALFRHVLTHPRIDEQRIPALLTLWNAARP
ncbi:MAG TPA: helix-turn-helix domain-containing protein [Mycobacterium sp.]|jgi:AcrR family transcriptional regulator|nr:helix-turn-helix domain-containing protein [Mycobacterium sp.]